MDRAVQLTTRKQSQFNKLLQSGDVSQALQLAKAAIVAVDVDEKIPQDQLKEKRKAVSAQSFWRDQTKQNDNPPTVREEILLFFI